jgi:hypothetical protein
MNEELLERIRYALDGDISSVELLKLYCEIVEDTKNWNVIDFERYDCLRTLVHKLMCDKLGINKRLSRSVTDNLSFYQYNSELVYNALLEVK